MLVLTSKVRTLRTRWGGRIEIWRKRWRLKKKLELRWRSGRGVRARDIGRRAGVEVMIRQYGRPADHTCLRMDQTGNP